MPLVNSVDFASACIEKFVSLNLYRKKYISEAVGLRFDGDCPAGIE